MLIESLCHFLFRLWKRCVDWNPNSALQLPAAHDCRSVQRHVWQGTTETLCTFITSFSPVSCAAVSPSLRSVTGTTSLSDSSLAQQVGTTLCLLAIDTSDGIMLSFLQQKYCLPHTELEKDRKSSFFYSPFFSIDHPKIFELNNTYFFLYVILEGSEICFSSFWSK